MAVRPILLVHNHCDHQVAPLAAVVPEVLEDPIRPLSPQAGCKWSHYPDDEENDSDKEEADIHISKALVPAETCEAIPFSAFVNASMRDA